MTQEAVAQADSPELTEFKRKLWFTAQRIMLAHGYEEAIGEILEELGIRAEDFVGEGFQEPEAEGLYRLENGNQDILIIRARATGYTDGQHWFITNATCPRSSTYDPVTWSKVLSDLMGRGCVNQENNWQLSLVKA